MFEFWYWIVRFLVDIFLCLLFGELVLKFVINGFLKVLFLKYFGVYMGFVWGVVGFGNIGIWWENKNRYFFIDIFKENFVKFY